MTEYSRLILFKLAMRLFSREWRSGEFRLLVLAVVVAVTAITSVSFFASRIDQALSRQASELMAADLVIVSDHSLGQPFMDTARNDGLESARTVIFPSMVLANGSSRLAEVKGVSSGYPLRGELQLRQKPGAEPFSPHGIPPKGTVWLESRLLQELGIHVGQEIQLGDGKFVVGGLIDQEPDRAGDFFNIVPRLMIGWDDLLATGLVQPASRVSYRFLVAGNPEKVSLFRAWAIKHLGRGERIESAEDARPQLRSALEQGRKYLGLAALVSAVLASVAIAMASRRFTDRHWNACALLRCFGAGQWMIFRLYLLQFIVLGLVASLLGVLLGFIAQTVLALWLGSLISQSLPQPSWMPLLEGVSLGLLILLALSMPPLIRLKNSTPSQVFRRDMDINLTWGILPYLLGVTVIALIIVWKSGTLQVGGYALAGIVGVLGISASITWLALALLKRIPADGGGSWRLGLRGLANRRWHGIAQVTGISVGLMALLMLSVVRGDLLDSWGEKLPPDAHNRFVINVQPDQRDALKKYIASQGLGAPGIYPMVKGRLLAINGKPVSSDHYQDEQAKRLLNREFNLSWTSVLNADNTIVEGKWWTSEDKGKPYFSVEQGIANRLGIHLGDELIYRIAGTPLQGKITNIRKVDWDSFHVNFFVVAPPGMLETFPATYITSFYLPPEHAALLDNLVNRFPNMTVINVSALMDQVRKIMDRVAWSAEFVFLFTLAAGALVLYGAVAATYDERLVEAALWRTLGSTRKQLFKAQLAEFIAVGIISGLIASLGAWAAASVLSLKVWNLPYHADPWLVITGVLAGIVVATLPGLFFIRHVADTPPMNILRYSE